MLKFFRLPFATTGDKTAVPDAVDSNGNVSYSQGYGFDYQRQKTDPAAKNIERDKMNQIFFDITTAIAEIQAQGVPDYITSALNGGSAYSYGQYAIVKYSGAVYISLVAANTALPSDATKWALLPTPALLQQAAYMSAVAAGTVDALTATFTPAIASLPAAPGTLSVFVRATGANATTTPTFKADGTAAKTIVKGANQALVAGDIAGAGHWLELQYDATLDKWVLQNPANGIVVVTSLPEVPVRQTVMQGPIDTAGLPTFLPATSASLSLTSQNIAAGTPLVVAAAAGFNATGAIDRIGYSTANLTWAGLTANSTNYLYVNIAANGTMTPGSTTLAPLYQNAGTPSNTNGQATFNIAQMQMFVGNGSAAPQTYRVFVGEAVTNASTVTSAYPYAYQGRYDTGWFVANANTSYAKTHRLGVTDVNTITWANSTASESGKYQADTSGGFTGASSFGTGVYKQINDRLTLTYLTGSNGIFYAIAGGGNPAVNSGYVRGIVQRSW